MKFLTQGFTRGFFRNADVRPAELKIAKFPDTRGPRTGSQPKFDCLVQMNELRSAPEGTTEWFLEEAASIDRRIQTARARCDAVNQRSKGFLNEGNNYGQ